MKINEATSTDLKVIKELEKLGWKIAIVKKKNCVVIPDL